MLSKIGNSSRDLTRSFSEDIQDNSLNYNAVPFSINDDDDEDDDDDDLDHNERTMTNSRRWSILEKLERRCCIYLYFFPL